MEGTNYKDKYESKAAKLYKRDLARRLQEQLEESESMSSGASPSPAELLGGDAPLSPKVCMRILSVFFRRVSSIVCCID